jgi:hypothetical protein
MSAGKKIIRHAGKGSKNELLPSRGALTRITQGDPSERSINGYAKRVPGLGQRTPSILNMGRRR